MIKFPMREVPTLHQEEKNILITRDWCTNKPTKLTLIFHQFLHTFSIAISQFTPPSPNPFVLLYSYNLSFFAYKKTYKLWGPMASSGCHFPLEDTRIHLKICMLFSCDSVFCQFQSTEPRQVKASFSSPIALLGCMDIFFPNNLMT